MLKKFALSLFAVFLSCASALAGNVYIQDHWDFYGPEPRSAHALSVSSGNWSNPGSALTTSVKQFNAQYGLARIKWARVVVVWTPGSDAKVRFYHADHGSADANGNLPGLTNCGNWITAPPAGSPVVSAVDVTACLNARIDAGIVKQIGYQIAGTSIINRVTLEIVWEIPTPEAAP